MHLDRFPTTHATWIEAQLTIIDDAERPGSESSGVGRASSARDALRRHVMERYTDALGAYVSATGLRASGERDEPVSGSTRARWPTRRSSGAGGRVACRCVAG